MAASLLFSSSRSAPQRVATSSIVQAVRLTTSRAYFASTSTPAARRVSEHPRIHTSPRIAGASLPLLKPHKNSHFGRTFASGPSNDSVERRAENARDRYAVGPFDARAAALFIATGIGLFLYFRHEKAAIDERKRLENAQARVGRPRIGGPFELVMPTVAHNAAEASKVEGRKVTDEDLKGAFSLIYFGFTNCPDICPEELDKMSEIVKSVDAKHGPVINPVFITCDPARDTLGATSIYVSEFHPRLMGLTGEYQAIKDACKQYRVYFSTPPGADPSGDYLVDHSIFFYLMDPEGKFVDAFGRSVNAQEASVKVMDFVDKWVDAGNSIAKADAKERIINDEARRV